MLVLEVQAGEVFTHSLTELLNPVFSEFDFFEGSLLSPQLL